MTVSVEPALDFTLPTDLEAAAPPEARGIPRDGVRLLVTRRALGTIEHRRFTGLPDLLEPGDVLAVNTSATLPAAVDAADGRTVHFSTELDDGTWLVELRRGPHPWAGGRAGQRVDLPGGAAVTLLATYTARLWRAGFGPGAVPAYLARHGRPIRYRYVDRAWPLAAYQTVFAREPGSAEMPSAGRPFTATVLRRLERRGVHVAPLLLHTGVASPEAHEPPYPERFAVPPSTARAVDAARRDGRRVVAVGTTVVRALESAVDGDGRVRPAAGWTDLVVTPERGLRAVDAVLTGLHEPRASHLALLEAVTGREVLAQGYAEALARGYLWHEFGDSHLLLP